ncbi:hypothetical protein DV738_g3148, partial [Chaetothyriales sp. CBS 135597]
MASKSNSLDELKAEVHSISNQLDGLRNKLDQFDTVMLGFTKLRTESLQQANDISSAVELVLKHLESASTNTNICPPRPEDSSQDHSPTLISVPDDQSLDDEDQVSTDRQALRPITRGYRLSQGAGKGSHQPSFGHIPGSSPRSAREGSSVSNDDREITTPSSPATGIEPRRSGRIIRRPSQHFPIQDRGFSSQALGGTDEPDPKRQKTDQSSGKGGLVLLYSQEEDEIIFAMVQKCQNTAVPNRQMFILTSEALKKKGFIRSPGAIQVRWYTKLRKELSARLAEVPDNAPPPDEVEEEPETQSETSMSAADSAQPTKPVQSPNSTLSHRLMSIRMGSSSADCKKSRSSHEALREAAGKHFVLARTWTGASNDVIDVSWSPDGVNYIAGSATQRDEYNRPNNLLLGSLVHNRLISLPDHRHRRRETNSSLADPWIYDTVSTVRWSSRGASRQDNTFFSAGFDGTVKQWDFSPVEGTASCELSYPHHDSVITMDLSAPSLGLFATATTHNQNSLSWYSIGDPRPKYIDLTSRKSRSVTDFIMCMRFGQSSQNMNYLVSGFASHSVDQDRGPSTSGYLGLWRFDESRVTPIDVSPNRQQVFDVAWSLSNDTFVAGQSRRRRTPIVDRSVVRLYSTKQEQMILQVDCEALDINEVGFCPFDENIVTASCTNRATYVWDIRRPDQLLHTLHHAKDTFASVRAEEDTGVRVLQWGRCQSELFTGGSDGKLLLWDIRRNPDDVYAETVLDTGVEQMSGALSPSMNEFLVGDAAGSIHLLERSSYLSDEPPIQLELLDETMVPSTDSNENDQDREEGQGREAARQLIESGIIEMHPDFGPVQGPKYKQRRKHAGSDQQAKNPEIERSKRLIFKFTQNRKRGHDAAFKDRSATTRTIRQAARPGSPDPSTEDDGSDNYFPPAWAVDANIQAFRSET